MGYRRKRVLVCAPQSDVKKYCFDEWAENVNNFSYPDYDVFLADNSLTKDFSKEIKSKGFKCINITDDSNKDSVLSRVAISHELCRQYAMRNNYDYILHLETDVFPPNDIIEQLMFEKKPIIGALYQLSDNESRVPMLNRISSDIDEYRHCIYGGYNNFMINGKVQKTLSVGLGCVLIARPIFSKFPFRHIEGASWFPDVVWINDLYAKNVPIYAHTGIICRHKNSNWGVFGKDYK
jgi:hypothetical protein|tara:strand:- start:4591 stop:5298 length:708 start_codon:yes stop_codon:yes gene_type:complete